MAQHSNYAKDRDLMMEAYSSVEGNIPPTQSTAPARMFNEAHCDEEHLPAEDGSCASHEDNEGSIKREVLEAIKAKAAEYGGDHKAMAAAAQELAAEYEKAGETEKASLATNQGAVFATYEDNESESGFTSTQKDELEDIVHNILDKREHEERLVRHEDAEGEHAGYSVGDMIDGHDGEEIVTAVEADGTIYTRELGPGGNKYTPEEINNLPS